MGKKRKKKPNDFGKIDPIRPFKGLPENSRTSFYLSPSRLNGQFTNSPLDNYYDRTGNPPNLSRLERPSEPWHPNTIYNYNSQYVRYQKALDLFPDKVEEEIDEAAGETTTIYYFPSLSNTTEGFWKVTRTEIDYSFRILKNLTIFCPSSFQLTSEYVDTNAPIVIWKQIDGSRTVLVSGNVPYPLLTVLGQCLPNTGCIETGEARPIILRAYPEGEPEDTDELIIFSIPTSFFLDGSPAIAGISTRINEDPSRQLCNTWYFVPPYSQKAFRWELNQKLPITWDYPKDPDSITHVEWQINLTGTYNFYSTIRNPQDPRIIYIEQAIHYRPVVYWDYSGKAYCYQDYPSRGLIDGRKRKIIGGVKRTVIIGDPIYRCDPSPLGFGVPGCTVYVPPVAFIRETIVKKRRKTVDGKIRIVRTPTQYYFGNDSTYEATIITGFSSYSAIDIKGTLLTYTDTTQAEHLAIIGGAQTFTFYPLGGQILSPSQDNTQSESIAVIGGLQYQTIYNVGGIIIG